MDYSDLPIAPGSTSPSLIRQVRDSDRDAWKRMVSVYGSLVYSWCRRSGLQSADASDVTQQVFQKVVRGISNFDYESDASTFRGWLRVITTHCLQDFGRRQKRIEKGGGGTDYQEGLNLVPFQEDPAVSDSVFDRPVNERLHNALQALRSEVQDRTWRAFWMMVVESRNAAEVAEELGMKEQAVYQARLRTLQRLRTLLQSSEESTS